MNSIKIVQCHIKDLNLFREIGIRCFKEAYEPVEHPVDFQLYLDRAYEIEQLKSEFKNPESAFYFLKKGAEIAGFIKLNEGNAQTEKLDSRYLEIERIYLLKKFYRQGLGTVLIDFAIEIAKSKGKEKVWLGVWEENARAISFYKKQGFKVFGEHTFMVGNLPEIDLMMEKIV